MPAVAPTVPRPRTEPIAWKPNPGGQKVFLRLNLWEVLAHGNRAGGKTDVLLMDFAQHVGRGFGASWRGILFRRTFPQLADIIARSKRWFRRIFPGAKLNEADYKWVFPDGEELYFRYMRTVKDYENYHGHEYPWIGWEELVNWPTSDCYEAMKSCSRSSEPEMPRKIRSTTNSYGSGHAWVKSYFISPAEPLVPVGEPGFSRTHVFMDLMQNQPFLDSDPDYPRRLEALTDENKRKSWRFGSWDIVAGAFFSDVWDASVHVLDPFPIPRNWYCDRAHDWGSAKPFCTLWFAESNGEQIADGRFWPKGTLFVIAEDYGWSGEPNQGLRLTDIAIAQRTKDAEAAMNLPIRPGPADDPIFEIRNGRSMAQNMGQMGIHWLKPSKGPGSRVTGWVRIRTLLEASLKRPMEYPGIFIFSVCRNLIRTLPSAPADEKDPDDIDTESEDHAIDCLRLRVLSRYHGAPIRLGVAT